MDQAKGKRATSQAKAYLNQIRILDCRIRRRKQQAEEIREAAMSIQSSRPEPGRVRSASPDRDPMAGKVGKYVDLLKEIDALILELVELKNTIIGQIEAIGDPRYMDVLWKRYVDLKTFDQIANEMSYDIGTIFRIHGKALKAFSELYDFMEIYED